MIYKISYMKYIGLIYVLKYLFIIRIIWWDRVTRDSSIRIVQTGKYIIYIFPNLILFVSRVVIRIWIEIVLPWLNIVWRFKAVARLPIRTRAIESTISWWPDFRFPNWILLMWKIIFIAIGIEKFSSVFIDTKILKWFLNDILVPRSFSKKYNM